MIGVADTSISSKETDFPRTDIIIDVPDTTFFITKTSLSALHITSGCDPDLDLAFSVNQQVSGVLGYVFRPECRNPMGNAD